MLMPNLGLQHLTCMMKIFRIKGHMLFCVCFGAPFAQPWLGGSDIITNAVVVVALCTVIVVLSALFARFIGGLIQVSQ